MNVVTKKQIKKEIIDNIEYTVVEHYYENNALFNKVYFLNDKIHNNHKAARIQFYANGNIKFKQYFSHGILHNINGPAFIEYFEDGQIKTQEYLIDGVLLANIRTYQEFKKYLKFKNF